MVAAGDPIESSDLTTVEDYTIRRPLARVYQTTAQTSLATATTYATTFTNEDFDTHGMHDNATNNSRLTPTLEGYYRFDGAVSLTGATDYVVIEAFIRMNGATALYPGGRYAAATTSGQTMVTVSGAPMVAMNGTTDYIELCFAFVKGAGTTSTVNSVQRSCTLQAEYLRPL